MNKNDFIELDFNVDYFKIMYNFQNTNVYYFGDFIEFLLNNYVLEYVECGDLFIDILLIKTKFKIYTIIFEKSGNIKLYKEPDIFDFKYKEYYDVLEILELHKTYIEKQNTEDINYKTLYLSKAINKEEHKYTLIVNSQYLDRTGNFNFKLEPINLYKEINKLKDMVLGLESKLKEINNEVPNNLIEIIKNNDIDYLLNNYVVEFISSNSKSILLVNKEDNQYTITIEGNSVKIYKDINLLKKTKNPNELINRFYIKFESSLNFEEYYLSRLKLNENKHKHIYSILVIVGSDYCYYPNADPSKFKQ